MILRPTTRKHSFITQIPSDRYAPVFLPILKNRLFLPEKQRIVGTLTYPIYHNCHYLQKYYICANFNIILMSLQSMLGRVYSKKALFITISIILSTVLFISACVHLHKVNELSLKTNYHNPVLVILVTL